MTDALSPERIAEAARIAREMASNWHPMPDRRAGETILALITERARLIAVATLAEQTRYADAPELHEAIDAWKAGGK